MANTNEATAYATFQKAVFESAEEGRRLDAGLENEVFIPYGRCPRHPGECTSVHGFDALCGLCEAEMAQE